MADLGTLLLAGLAFKALGSKPATPKVPDPPPVPDNKGGGLDAGKIGGLAGTAASGLLSLLGGGSGAGGTGAAVTGGTTAAAPVAAEVAATTTEVASVTVVSAGGIFGLAWASFFVLQFILINALTGARVAWLRYRNSIMDLANSPLPHLHHLERALVDQTLEMMRLTPSRHDADDTAIEGSQRLSNGLGSDPRLDVVKLVAVDGQTVGVAYHENRQIYDNPFAGLGAPFQWRFLQMCARLVAARYVVELGKYARRMLHGFPGLGGLELGLPTPADFETIWSYPLLGGGQPDKSYGAFEAEVRALGPAADGTTLDDVLNSARLAAILHVAQTIQQDPGIYIDGNAAVYSLNLFTALQLGADEHVAYAGTQWLFDGAFYKVPCRLLALDVHELKGGMLPMQPFVPGTGTRQPPSLTCLKALS